MTLKLYNTMNNRKEEFIPRTPDEVSMYVCGPTTYDYIHLGNARPLIVFDMVRRYLEYKGYKVNYVQNFTDIDDKIIKRAQEEKDDALALAKRYINEFFKDAKALGVREATEHPKVSDHIPEVIELIKSLVKKGYAYEVSGDVYFDVREFEGYGKLSGRCLDDMQAGARINVDERKNHPMDFALWKKAKKGEPSWESPWGYGRPGWHIECSAMAQKYLGANFDIHGGGYDLVFPHHENEIAQSEACTGQPFAKYWMHNGFITINEEKMSKSLGNFFTVREVLKKYDPQVVRFYMLATHYRSPLDFDDSKLEMNKKSLDRLVNTVKRVKEYIGTENNLNVTLSKKLETHELVQSSEKAIEDFVAAMDDDFNTALAIAVVFDLSRDINGFSNKVGTSSTEEETNALKYALKTIHTLTQILGIDLDQESESHPNEGLTDKLMELIIDIRQEARSKKDWGTADKIRDELKDAGVMLEDTPQGVRWKINK